MQTDFSARWDGQKVLSITNDTNAFGYTEYTYVVTAASSTSTLEFSAAGSPWFVDNISLAQNNGTSAPVVSSIGETPSSSDLNAGKTVTYNNHERGGERQHREWLADAFPQRWRYRHLCQRLWQQHTDLQLHRASGQNTADLTVTAVNLNDATIQDSSGNAANLSLTGISQGSPQIDTTPPTIASVTATAGDYKPAKC